MKRHIALYFLPILFVSSQFIAQNFNPYVVLGTNLTEARLTESGKSQIGFRMGINIGAGVSMRMAKRLDMNTEFLYSENGLYSNFVQFPTIALDKITLKYFEVPVNLRLSINKDKRKKKTIYGQTISGGITYARLFNHKIIAVDDSDVTNDVRFEQVNSLLFNVGATSFFSESLALNGKVTTSRFRNFTYALRMILYLNRKGKHIEA